MLSHGEHFAYLANLCKQFFAYLAVAMFCPIGKLPDMSGNRIKIVRKERGLTLDDLAEKTGLSVSYVQRMENGERNLSMKNLNKIAGALEVAPAELIEARSEDQRVIDAYHRATAAQKSAVDLILHLENPSEESAEQSVSHQGKRRATPK